MRLIIIGTPAERRRFRESLEHSPFEVVAELASRADVDDARIDADAVLEAIDVVPTEAHDGTAAFGEPLAESLTAREIEVLELIAEGLPNKAIAARLGISDQTVKFHASSIQGKLGAANRTDAVRRAVRRGLVTL
jgi:DNA-binding NarL/FixJ family response regulator